MTWKFTVFIKTVMFHGIIGGKIAPDYIAPCPLLSPDCLKRTIQEVIPKFVKGEPSLGLIELDPLHQNKLNLSLPGGLDINFTNGTITGLRNCDIDSAAYKQAELDINLHCDLIVSGLYKVNGRILIFSINGEGEAHINATNMVLKSKLFFEDRVKNGTEYRELENFSLDYEYAGKVLFNITNLIKGYPSISETVLSFLNLNWMLIANEFGKPIIDSAVGVVIDDVQKFFSTIPKEELFVDP